MKEKVRKLNGKFTITESKIIKRELDRIKSKYGKLNPVIIVKCAKSQKSVLHKYFEWDVDKCVKQWQLHQARILVEGIVEVFREDQEPIRSFVSVRKGKEHIYVSMQEAIKKKEYRKQLLGRMLTTSKNLSYLIDLFMNQ